MGIETAGMMAMAAMGGMAMSSMMAPKMPGVAAVTQAEKPPQAAKPADRNAMATNNATMAGPGGPLSGNSGTFLTGPTGVDPASLNLGRNTLLGQ